MEIDWRKDYKGEFACPSCQTKGLQFWSKEKGIERFKCSNCYKKSQGTCQINIRVIADSINPGVIWYTNHRYKDFVCPECEAREIYFQRINHKDKKNFICKNCGKNQSDSHLINRNNISRFSNNEIPVKPFDFNDDQWDLRAINPNFDLQDNKAPNVNFSLIQIDWLKREVKNYVQHLCKIGNSFGTIHVNICNLKYFSSYLEQINIIGFHQINRSLLCDYLVYEKNITRKKIGVLRNFFRIGTIKGWFNIDQDIIRDDDYPKWHKENPDPLSDIVRKQIEENLYKLPKPIARMWIICFFSAMRSSELALLKKDCLVQEGQEWKLVWHRKKTNDEHEVPISRTIAKVVQEQQDYINTLWGSDWEYLFCHYNELSRTNPSQPKLEPIKKVFYLTKNPLSIAIKCLIKAENILDENGQLAEFRPRLLRSTRLTQLFEKGHDLAVVSAWAGHESFATTSTYYTKVSCELMEKEGGHIQKALFNNNGRPILYESLPKSFWETPVAHKLELEGTHVNTPIYGFCGLPLEDDCKKFRSCYTCPCFVAAPEKLSQYIKVRDELRGKEVNALTSGCDVLVEQFGRQAEQLDKIILSLQEAV